MERLQRLDSRVVLGVLGLVSGVLLATLYFQIFRAKDFGRGGAKPIHLRWLVTHSRENARLVADARKFVDRVRIRSNGRIIVDLETPKASYVDGANFKEALDEVRGGISQMSEVTAGSLTERDALFEVFDLPFLFRSHAHLAAVLDGPIGERLIASFAKSDEKNLRLVTLSYLGGFRAFVSNRPLQSFADLAGQRISKMKVYGSDNSETDPISNTRLSTFQAEGLRPVAIELPQMPTTITSELEPFRQNLVDAGEDSFGHYARVFRGYGLLRGKMDYFLDAKQTAIVYAFVMNDGFLNRLDKSMRDMVLEEVVRLSRAQRESGVHSENLSRDWLVKSGYHVASVSDAQREKMLARLKPVYVQTALKVSSELIDEIRRTGESFRSGE